jgi:chorismate mutase-like protein
MTIEERRAEIDRIDSDLLHILNLRAQVACEIAALKRANGAALCDPQRERQVVERAQQSNRGPLDGQAVARIFRAVIEESRQLESQRERQFEEKAGNKEEHTHDR